MFSRCLSTELVKGQILAEFRTTPTVRQVLGEHPQSWHLIINIQKNISLVSTTCVDIHENVYYHGTQNRHLPLQTSKAHLKLHFFSLSGAIQPFVFKTTTLDSSETISFSIKFKFGLFIMSNEDVLNA